MACKQHVDKGESSHACDGTETSSGFQTKPWLIAITACSKRATRYRPPADFFGIGYEVVEASQSWMTVSQHQGARGSHAAPPPLVAILRALLTDNADESRKSEHDTIRAIAVATTPSAGPSQWSERVRASPSARASSVPPKTCSRHPPTPSYNVYGFVQITLTPERR